MRTLLQNRKGFGLIEAIVGFALIGIGTFVVLNAVGFLGDRKTVADKSAALESMVTGLVEAIRSNIAMEKVDFKAEDFLSNTNFEAVRESLKLCWVNDGIIPLSEYPGCPGRMGYVITTLKTGPLELRGLYKVTIRVTHEELFPNQFKQYEFIVKDP
jgi:hypothetical protein